MEFAKTFQSIAERWFLSEPALFAIYCTHGMLENPNMTCAMRSGKGHIEYNPLLLQGMPENTVEEFLKAEVIRILLKHPYERKPSDCCDAACGMGSECVLTSYYSWKGVNFINPSMFSLPKMQTYEWYAINIQKMLQSKEGEADQDDEANSDNTDDRQNKGRGKTGEEDSQNDDAKDEGQDDGDGSSSMDEDSSSSAQNKFASMSELWEEDELMQVQINETVENIHQWGSVPGDLVERIIANTKAHVDYRKILAGFCASVLSSKRNLTRMRPNRRTEFQNMGSVYKFRTNIIVAVDVSGSISSDTLRHFYSVINRFFRYGVENIDAVQFDSVPGAIEPIKKASRDICVKGRGGTDFQPVIDLVAEKKCYDGLIIFTDGYADRPVLPPIFHTRILWVCNNKQNYEEHYEWMRKYGRVCTMIL